MSTDLKPGLDPLTKDKLVAASYLGGEGKLTGDKINLLRSVERGTLDRDLKLFDDDYSTGYKYVNRYLTNLRNISKALGKTGDISGQIPKPQPSIDALLADPTIKSIENLRKKKLYEYLVNYQKKEEELVQKRTILVPGPFGRIIPISGQLDLAIEKLRKKQNLLQYKITNPNSFPIYSDEIRLYFSPDQLDILQPFLTENGVDDNDIVLGNKIVDLNKINEYIEKNKTSLPLYFFDTKFSSQILSEIKG